MISSQVNDIHNPFGWSCDRVVPPLIGPVVDCGQGPLGPRSVSTTRANKLFVA